MPPKRAPLQLPLAPWPAQISIHEILDFKRPHFGWWAHIPIMEGAATQAGEKDDCCAAVTCRDLFEDSSSNFRSLGYIRIKEGAATIFQRSQLHPLLRSLSFGFYDVENHFDRDALIRDALRFHLSDPPAGVSVLSLLDVAVISGDAGNARMLYDIGVPQLHRLRHHHLCNPRTGIADRRSTKAVMTASCVASCRSLFEDMRSDEQLISRAIAGKQDSMVNMLTNAGICASAKRQVGHFFFSISITPQSRNHCWLALKLPCLQLAVAAGFDLRSLQVDPCCVLGQSIQQYRYYEIKNDMQRFFFSLIGGVSWAENLVNEVDPWDRRHGRVHGPRPRKWRGSQTLLEMAIRCGQLDATRYLTRACCEATSLTADDLVGPMFESTYDNDFDPPQLLVTINKNARCAEAMRLAYHLSRNRYQVLIVQMSGWWSRLKRTVSIHNAVFVSFADLVDYIATFALAVPPLPEILQLPPPFGYRSAVKRAARRAHRARYGGFAEDKMRACNTSSDQETTKPHETLATQVIQEVVDDSGEQPTMIGETEAQATARALWEAAVESTITTSPTKRSSSQAGIVEQEQSRLPAPEHVFLGKLNRIPAELRTELAEGPALRPYRDALLAKGLSWKLDSGAMIFVHPWQHSEVKATLGHQQLHPDHVVFTESAEYLVEEVLERYGTWIRSRSQLDQGDIDRTASYSNSECSGCRAEAGSHSGELEVAWAPYITMDRTFLCLADPAPAGDPAVTVSSTDLYTPSANPRRVQSRLV